MMIAIKSGKFAGNGDKLKAAKVLYEVVIGKGVGAGHEGERFLPLGSDMLSRLALIRDQCGHALEVFGETSKSIAIDKK